MQVKIKYEFSGKLWKDQSSGGWVFISIPKNISKEIRKNLQWQEDGWGRMKAVAAIKDVKWDTAIWFDTKMDTYLLPVKIEIRKKTSLNLNDKIRVTIWI
ncbi:DUF1905 domain-containing protein [uncultured Kordia sp.]|uniref:DUF1905 domain-containing protein n=1 Tax=uncultured Kordia sp. TaxID=507699 RepID=UPI002629640A|nr:DUF1905 domain-containing protein [uncultured Kordia sp.]